MPLHDPQIDLLPFQRLLDLLRIADDETYLYIPVSFVKIGQDGCGIT